LEVKKTAKFSKKQCTEWVRLCKNEGFGPSFFVADDLLNVKKGLRNAIFRSKISLRRDAFLYYYFIQKIVSSLFEFSK